MDRREFLAAGAAGGVTAARAEAPPVRLGVVGLGNRGSALLGVALRAPDVQVVALCDTDPAMGERAQARIVKAGQAPARIFDRSQDDYKRLMDRKDLDAVLIATPWHFHTPMAVYGMQAGKYVGVEVPAALTVEECWQLVETHEKTGTACMMMENWSFRRDNLAVLNMIRAGLLGTMVHCHCAHSHDCVDHWFFDKAGNMRWGGEYLVKRNADQYPTHALGPVLSWLDINRGDAFDTISSHATESRGINEYFKRQFGAGHPNATRKYKQGDIVTSVLRTKAGKTVVLNYDMQLPRPYDNRWMVQGTLGLYREQPGTVYVAGRSAKYHEWEPFDPYQKEFDHKWWKPRETGAAGSDPLAGGHGGTDDVEVRLFLDAARRRTPTPLDLYDSVTMSAVIGMSESSIAKSGAPLPFPDFTRGRWKTNKPYFGL
jgi:predicted dehydrogenase